MTSKVKYWHELSDTEVNALREAGGMTWAEAQVKYPAPPWCGYGPEAVCGIMGCWSLMGECKAKRIRKREDCEGCDIMEVENVS